MSRGLLGIIKFVIFLLLLPVIVAGIDGFSYALGDMRKLSDPFWWGVIAYVVFHLFVFTPQMVFQFIKGVFSEMLSFSTFLGETVPYILPLGLTLFLLVVYLLNLLLGWTMKPSWAVGISGCLFAMHVILGTQELYEGDESHLKGHYLFGAAIVFIINLVVLACLLDLNFSKFESSKFFGRSWQVIKHAYTFAIDKID